MVEGGVLRDVLWSALAAALAMLLVLAVITGPGEDARYRAQNGEDEEP